MSVRIDHDGGKVRIVGSAASLDALAVGHDADATDNFTVTSSGNTVVGGTLAVTGAQTMTGNTTLSGTLGVTGATTLSSTLAVTGASTLTGAVTMSGAATVGTTLGVTGAATLSSTLGVTGASTLTGAVTMSGAATVGTTLGVTGATTLSSTLAVTGASTLTGGIAAIGASLATVHAGGYVPGSLSEGTDTAPTAGLIEYAIAFVPSNGTFTGMAILNGSVDGTHKIVLGVYNIAGTLLASTALAGTLSSGTNAYQEIAFTAPIAIVGPQYVFLACQFEGITPRFRKSVVHGTIAGTQAGAFGTMAAIGTPSTSRAAAPILYMYD